MSSQPAGIAYVLVQHPRTTQTFINAELAELRKRGHDVVIFALNRPGADQIRTEEDRGEARQTVYLKQVGIPRLVHSVTSAVRENPRGMARVVLRALRSAGTDVRRVLWRMFQLVEAVVVWDECRHRDVSVIHAHFGQSTSTVAWLAANLARELGSGASEWVMTVHGGSEVEDRAETIPATKVGDARVTIAISDHTRSQLMRHVAASHWDRIHVVRCGIDLEFFPFEPREPHSEVPTIVFVGRLDPAKGVPVLLSAARLLEERGIRIQLVIIGAGPLETSLRSQTAAVASIRFTGELPPDQVRDWLHRADAFCLPSFDEGIPVSIMEAMAMGIPVVTTAVAGIPELAVDEKTALVVPPGNALALADALGRVLQDRTLVEEIRRQARARVEALHDADKTLPEVVRLLVCPPA